MAKHTPMMKQYLTIKAQYKDAFLFFRLGDFYELFFDDAVKASQELEITLTSRDGGSEDRIPMCGVPHHSAENYIHQLIERGYKVAICEQTEDPKQAKGVVKREVVQLITPGTIMNGKMIQDKENNYLAAVTDFEDRTHGLCFTDLTTGEMKVTILSNGWDEVIQEVFSIGSKEIVLSTNVSEEKRQSLIQRLDVTLSFEEDASCPIGLEGITNNLGQVKLQNSVGRLLQYLVRTQKRSLDHLQQAEYYEVNQYMKLDIHSKRNLELVETIRSKGRKGSLLWLLDSTVTAMGGRMLKHWIERPLIDQGEIEKRLSMVETLMQQFFQKEELREKLKEVYDLERLAGRVAFGNVNARDLIQLKKSLQQIPEIIETINELDHPYAKETAKGIDPLPKLFEILDKGIKDNPPISVKEGNMINDGYDERLDQYRDASRNGKSWIASLELKEREQTGIRSLKIGYNRVFGYYIEVTKANLHLLPEGRYERKQTLTNAERYITPELKEKEALIMEAEEKIVDLEYNLFLEIREQVKSYIPMLQKLAKIISDIDVLQSFATVSEEYHYTKPVFSENREIHIQDGRHPVVEKVMNSQEYVANDVSMNVDREILLITGPNMSGKSTYMRQTALTAILAQIGCFVPAEHAVLPIFDQVFTRIGAADDLVSGQSTFMVEMLEAKNAITNATKDSLILLDEIGRGTSTYDGMALAQAIIEYIHEDIGAKTLFSTHYHELTTLEQELKQLKNIHVSAIENNGRVVFLHKIQEGFADKSYGIHVAELAELPEKLINRAKDILVKLESDSKQKIDASSYVSATSEMISENIEDSSDEQLSLFIDNRKSEQKNKTSSSTEEGKASEILKWVETIDLLDMTPIEALNELYKIQKKVKA